MHPTVRVWQILYRDHADHTRSVNRVAPDKYAAIALAALMPSCGKVTACVELTGFLRLEALGISRTLVQELQP